MRNDYERLAHIRDSIQSIEQVAVAGGRQEFEDSPSVREQILSRLHQIAQASRELSCNLKRHHPDVDWKRVKSLEGILQYRKENVDPDMLWLIVEQELPAVRREIRIVFQTVETQIV